MIIEETPETRGKNEQETKQQVSMLIDDNETPLD
jgi:hypothetical protein